MVTQIEMKAWDKKRFRNYQSGSSVTVVSGAVSVICDVWEGMQWSKHDELQRPASGPLLIPAKTKYALWAYERSVVNIAK